MINKQPKKTTTKAKKIEVVAKLSEKVAKAKALVFTNYQGLTHQQLEHLKKQLRAADAELVIAKNTLLLRSIENCKLKIENLFEGPTATLLAYGDVIAPLKALAKMIKELKLPEIKFGIVENNTLNADQINKLSALPPKEILLAQVVGGLKSSLYGLHRALNWNLQKLVLTLSAIQQKKV